MIISYEKKKKNRNKKKEDSNVTGFELRVLK